MIASRRWPFWLLVLILIFIYFTLNLAFGLGRAAPDLLTVAVLLSARRLNAAGAAAVGLILGLMRDALSLVAFGASAVAFTILGFLGARSRDLFVGDSLLFVAVYLFIGKWLYEAIFYGLAHQVVREPPMELLLIQGPIAAAYAAIAGTLALLLYRVIIRES